MPSEAHPPAARDLLPARWLPLVYFGFAHLALGGALGALVVDPGLPGAFFHHPRMVAIIHLVTLGWISASILGAFYIVAPLALRCPLRPGWRDRAACAAYIAGVSGMVSHFWIGRYNGMAWSALLVIVSVMHLAVRAWRALPHAPVPWPVKLHVYLAFANIGVASAAGVVIGLNRQYAWFEIGAMSSAFAHAHLAALGWAVMMVVGLSYRLVPMIVPAEMPRGPSMAASAVLLEIGVVALAVSLVLEISSTPAALIVIGGLAAFVMHVRRVVSRRLPPPAALVRPDWATWQTHLAFGYLLVAAVTGVALTLSPLEVLAPLGWTYGVTGLIGFLGQVVVGIQGRLLPLHGWYRAFESRGAKPPRQSAHTIGSRLLAAWVLGTWAPGVPLLATGLAWGLEPAIAAGALSLLAGVVLNAAHMARIAAVSGEARTMAAAPPR
jgi:hypothetical protein